MKKITKFLVRLVSAAAPLSLALAILTSNSTCYWFTHQPDVPASLARYKKR